MQRNLTSQEIFYAVSQSTGQGWNYGAETSLLHGFVDGMSRLLAKNNIALPNGQNVYKAWQAHLENPAETGMSGICENCGAPCEYDAEVMICEACESGRTPQPGVHTQCGP